MISVDGTMTGKAAYRRLLTYVKPYSAGFVGAIIGLVVVAATEPGFAALMQPMLDGSFVNKDPVAIKLVPIMLIGIFIIRGIGVFVSTYFMTWVGRNIIRDIRAQLFDHLLNLPTQYYDNNSSGQLTTRLIYHVEQVAQAASEAVTVIIRDSLTIIGLLAMMFYLNWMLSLTFLLVGPIISIIVVVVSKRFRRYSRRIQSSMGDVTHVSQEAIDGHRVIKIFGGQQYESAHFAEVNEYNRRQNLKMAVTQAANVPISQLVAACALSLIVYLATMESILGQVTVGTFMAFISAMMLLLAPLKRLINVNVTLQKGIAASQSIFGFLDQPKEVDTGTRPTGRVEGDVSFQGVDFAYEGQENSALHDINLDIKAGSSVAFVGRSGSGKTTLVSLLPRFYDYSIGSITIDGTDIRDMTLASLRSNIALVSQQVVLFNDTIAKNIAYGSLAGATREQIVQAAQAAHAMEFIEKMPQGLDTVVGENGVLLSGGQRQRLAIARAILKNAPLLILDEATSALDTESERHIQAAMEELMQNRTTLVIAHRLSTIENVDNIVVLHEGRIIETGQHADLLAKGGQYANLYRMQFSDSK